jgi:GNAT superfamily N-acetyltransferase
MPVVMRSPGVAGLPGVIDSLREWQRDGVATQLHPGDLGWFWRLGVEATAAAVRTWSADGRLVAVGLLDEPTVVRLALDPDARQDLGLAHQVAADLSDPARGVLPAGKVYVEAPAGSRVRDALTEHGWGDAEPWTSLRLDLARPLPDPGVRIEVVDPSLVPARTAVQRGAFETSTFTDERWHAMAAGPAYADARCLLAFDERDRPAAAVTVWSAGRGRPGLLEPMGVHRDHRGQGHGRAITRAAGAALRQLGSSYAVVCTRSANAGGIATYRSAGFEPVAEVADRVRQ